MSVQPTQSLKESELESIRSIAAAHADVKGAAIPVLQAVQNTLGYVSKEAIDAISKATGMPASDLYSIVTFYSQFRLEPLGEYVIKVCHGTACHLAEADKITQAVEMATGAKEGSTSADGRFTHERVACLGCCSLAPVLMVNGDVHARLESDRIKRMLDDIVRRTEASKKKDVLTQGAGEDKTNDPS